MTAAELRVLLERVADLGGPMELFAPHASDDERAGALKRDLIERGYGLDIHLGPPGARVTLLEVKQLDSGFWAPEEKCRGDGRSELEAVLKAWLAVAEAEGWSA